MTIEVPRQISAIPVPASEGGTGFSSYTVGDLLYANSTNSLAKRAIGSNGYILTVVGGLPTWAAASGGVAIGTTVTGGTQGSVLFVGAASALAQDNDHFFWDPSDLQFGVGTNTFTASERQKTVGIPAPVINDPPTGVSTTINYGVGSFQAIGQTHTYRLYSYKTLGIVDFYSPAYIDTAPVTDNGSTFSPTPPTGSTATPNTGGTGYLADGSSHSYSIYSVDSRAGVAVYSSSSDSASTSLSPDTVSDASGLNSGPSYGAGSYVASGLSWTTYVWAYKDGLGGRVFAVNPTTTGFSDDGSFSNFTIESSWTPSGDATGYIYAATDGTTTWFGDVGNVTSYSDSGSLGTGTPTVTPTSIAYPYAIDLSWTLTGTSSTVKIVRNDGSWRLVSGLSILDSNSGWTAGPAVLTPTTIPESYSIQIDYTPDVSASGTLVTRLQDSYYINSLSNSVTDDNTTFSAPPLPDISNIYTYGISHLATGNIDLTGQLLCRDTFFPTAYAFGTGWTFTRNKQLTLGDPLQPGSAIGTNSGFIGFQNNVSSGNGSNNFFFGADNAGTGGSLQFSTIVGTENILLGSTQYAHCFGWSNTLTSANQVCAFGQQNTITSSACVAVGFSNTSTVSSGFTFGSTNNTSGSTALAVGVLNTVSSNFSAAFGFGASVATPNTISLAALSQAGDVTSVTIQGKSTSTGAATRDMIGIATVWATSTNASRKARAVFNVYDTVAREAFRIEASGSVPMMGFFGAAAVVRQNTTGTLTGFTANASANITYNESTYTGNTSATAYTVGDIVRALKQLGLMAS